MTWDNGTGADDQGVRARLSPSLASRDVVLSRRGDDCDREAQSVDRAGGRTTYWTRIVEWLVAQGDCGPWGGVGDGAMG